MEFTVCSNLQASEEQGVIDGVAHDGMLIAPCRPPRRREGRLDELAKSIRAFIEAL